MFTSRHSSVLLFLAFVSFTNAYLTWFDDCLSYNVVTVQDPSTTTVSTTIPSNDCGIACSTDPTCTGVTSDQSVNPATCTQYYSPVTALGMGGNLYTTGTLIKRSSQFAIPTDYTLPTDTMCYVFPIGSGCAGTVVPPSVGTQHGLVRSTSTGQGVTTTPAYDDCTAGSQRAYDCCVYQAGGSSDGTPPDTTDTSTCATKYFSNVDSCNLVGDSSTCTSIYTTTGDINSCCAGEYMGQFTVPADSEGSSCQYGGSGGTEPLRKRDHRHPSLRWVKRDLVV